jgi:hypothetical protein
MSEVEAKPQVNQAVVEGLAKFGQTSLKHVPPPAEKVVLPSKEDIESEKQHFSLVQGVEGFDKNKLKPTVTQEKLILPDKDGKSSFKI